MKLIGILGGTFDPVHYGHLRMGQELLQALRLDEVRFIPAANPPHRVQPAVSASHRAEMLRLAMADNPQFRLDDRELKRTGPSYTVDTLLSLRAELGKSVSLNLLLGSDAFLGLSSWQRWDELLSLAHIVVAHRPHAAPLPGNMAEPLKVLWQQHVTSAIEDLARASCGKILLHHITALDISASQIREQLAQGASPRYLLPEPVINYITTHHLYA